MYTHCYRFYCHLVTNAKVCRRPMCLLDSKNDVQQWYCSNTDSVFHCTVWCQLPSLIRQQSIDDDVVVGGKTKFALDAVKVFFENDLTKSFGNRTNNMTVKVRNWVTV